MKQPMNGLGVLVHNFHGKPEFWIDLDSSDGDCCKSAVSVARSENMAWKKAIARLQKLTEYAKDKYQETL